jgi:hypothetical protein
MGGNDGTAEVLLRVMKWKSPIGTEVVWTESVRRGKVEKGNESSETIVPDVEGGESERGRPDYRALLTTGPIAFDVHDPSNPKTWSDAKKWYISVAATIGGITPFECP